MKYLYVGASPEVAPEDHQMVAGLLRRELGDAVREAAIPAVEFAFDGERRQYGSAGVLEMLLRICPPDADKFLAVTDRDLFVPALTFVFGQAQLRGRVGVVSLARLRQEFYGFAPNREVFVDRAAKEALHEAGHLFGLVHCEDRSCAMSLATNVLQIDEKRAAYCPACRGRLRRRPGESQE